MQIRLMRCVGVQSHSLMMAGVLPAATAHALQVVAALQQPGSTVEQPTPWQRPVH
jgi:hypothetical protein